MDLMLEDFGRETRIRESERAPRSSNERKVDPVPERGGCCVNTMHVCPHRSLQQAPLQESVYPCSTVKPLCQEPLNKNLAHEPPSFSEIGIPDVILTALLHPSPLVAALQLEIHMSWLGTHDFWARRHQEGPEADPPDKHDGAAARVCNRERSIVGRGSIYGFRQWPVVQRAHTDWCGDLAFGTQTYPSYNTCQL